MNKKEFFQELEEGLPDDAYKKRFLSELEDHLEDAEYAAHFKKSPDDLSPLERLGEPESIIINYKKIMRKYATFFIQLENLFWGVMVSVFYFLPFFCDSLIGEFVPMLLKIPALFVSWILIASAFYLIYKALISFLDSSLISLNENQKIISFILLITPGWITTMINIGIFAKYQDSFFPLVIFSFLLVITAVVGWLYFLKPKKIQTNHMSKNFLFEIIFTVFTLGMAYLFYRNIGAPWSPLAWSFFQAGNMGIYLGGLAIMAILLLIYCCYGLYISFAKKTYPSIIKISLAILILYGFLVPHDGGLINKNIPGVYWQKDVIEVSTIFKHEELGVLYNWASFAWQDSLYAFEYRISPTEDGRFLINMYPNNAYILDPSSLKFEKQALVYMNDLDDEYQVLPADLLCAGHKPGTIYDINFNETLHESCNGLTYKGVEILKTNKTPDEAIHVIPSVRSFMDYSVSRGVQFSGEYGSIYDIVISSDGQYMLLSINNSLYLVTL